jgi:hypothetical protein
MTQLTPGQPGIAGKPGRFVHSLAAALDYVLGHRGNPPSDNFKGAPRALPPHGTKCNLLYPQPFPVQCIAPGDVIRDVENLWLVTGGGDFDKMEVRLNSHLERIRLQEHAPVNAPGALFHSIWNAANDCRAQVVLLDVSPALGNTNQNLLLHCDYFLTPCEANKLSEKNLTSIPATFRDWYKQYAGGNPRTAIRDISRGIPYTEDIREVNRDAELPLPDIEPKFIGIILSRVDVNPKCKLNAWPQRLKDKEHCPTFCQTGQLCLMGPADKTPPCRRGTHPCNGRHMNLQRETVRNRQQGNRAAQLHEASMQVARKLFRGGQGGSHIDADPVPPAPPEGAPPEGTPPEGPPLRFGRRIKEDIDYLPRPGGGFSIPVDGTHFTNHPQHANTDNSDLFTQLWEDPLAFGDWCHKSAKSYVSKRPCSQYPY